MISPVDKKIIEGLSREIAATADVIEQYSDDHGMLKDLVTILYDQSEKLANVLLRTEPKTHWLEDQLQRVTFQRETTHRSGLR